MIRRWCSRLWLFCGIAGCRGESGSLPARATVSGDTTLVLAKGDGEWGAPFGAVAVLTVAPDRDENTLGHVRFHGARRDGGILLFDQKASGGPVIRAFDSSGTFEHNYGRFGGGPGEYNTERISIAEAPDGSILVRDGARAINRYARDGRVLNSFALTGRDNQIGIVGATDGSILTFAGQPEHRPTNPSLATVLRYDTTGRVLDSLLPSSSWVNAQLPAFSGSGPRQFWYPLADGRAAIGRADRLAFLVVDLRGKGVPLIGEVPSAAVPVPEAAFAEQQRAGIASSKNGSGGPVIGRSEQPARMLTVDVNQRIWIQKNVPQIKGKSYCTSAVRDRNGESHCLATGSFWVPLTYVAFQADGTFLGEVRFPANLRSSPAATGKFAWAIVENDDGEEVLAKFRIRR